MSAADNYRHRIGNVVVVVLLLRFGSCWAQTISAVDGKQLQQPPQQQQHQQQQHQPLPNKDTSNNQLIKVEKSKEDAYIIDHQNDNHRTPIIIEETDEVYEPETIDVKTPGEHKDEILIPLQPNYHHHHQHHQQHHHHHQRYPSSFAHLKFEQPNQPIMVHVVPPGVRRKYESTIPDLLAVLAPLAAIPLLSSLAVSTFSTMVTLHGLGRRRRRRRRRDLSTVFHHTLLERLHSASPATSSSSSSSNGGAEGFNLTDLAEHDLASVYQHNLIKLTQINQTNAGLGLGGDNVPRDNETTSNASGTEEDATTTTNNQTMNSMSELFQLDIVQQYLRQSGRPDHNDQIIASYLECRGMFLASNHCLERLACHYGDMQNGRLRPLERDVAALIIYSLLRNSHIDNSFKRRLQRAALFGYDHASARVVDGAGGGGGGGGAAYETAFVPICDREFPCPRSEMP